MWIGSIHTQTDTHAHTRTNTHIYTHSITHKHTHTRCVYLLLYNITVHIQVIDIGLTMQIDNGTIELCYIALCGWEIYIRTHVRTHTHTYKHTFPLHASGSHTHTYTHTHTQPHHYTLAPHTNTHTHTHTHTHTYTHTHIHSHTHTHTHTHTAPDLILGPHDLTALDDSTPGRAMTWRQL